MAKVIFQRCTRTAVASVYLADQQYVAAVLSTNIATGRARICATAEPNTFYII